MADFSFLSDSDEEKAVEELLSKAIDHTVLEQVAAINCSGFTDSVLPTNLETRFRKLKSFPASKCKSPNLTTHKTSASLTFNSKLPSHITPKTVLDTELKNSFETINHSDTLSDGENMVCSTSKNGPDAKKNLKQKSTSNFHSSDSESSNYSAESGIFSPSKQIPERKMNLKSKSQSGSFLSPSNSSKDSPSPPRRTGCFWCSPKTDSRKKPKENRVMGIAPDGGKNDEFLSDLSTYSMKEQQKMLKKAMKEEQKISREAEKIVQWAKQASARMDVTGIEDELSDSESTR